MVLGDQSAEFAARHLEVVVRRFQIALDAVDVAAQRRHIVRIGLGGQLALHVIELLRIVGTDLLGLLPGAGQLALRQFQVIGDRVHLRLNFGIALLCLRQTPIQHVHVLLKVLVLLGQRLFAAFRVGRGVPAHAQRRRLIFQLIRLVLTPPTAGFLHRSCSCPPVRQS